MPPAVVETFRLLASVRQFFAGALWSARLATMDWQLLITPKRVRSIRGWVHVQAQCRGGRHDARTAQVWLYGAAIWEFEFRTTSQCTAVSGPKSSSSSAR